MKIINFGSLNIDRVYTVEDFVQPGQTIFARNYAIFPGGKGLNQSVAAARAGAEVLHAGMTGQDGLFLKALLEEAGVDTRHLQVLDVPAGHAVIEVSRAGQNRIIVCGGTNQMLTEPYIDSVLQEGKPGDLVLLQNETNLIAYIIQKAHEKGLRVAFNPSPVPENPEILPLNQVDFFLLNELEGAQLAGTGADTPFEETLRILAEKFPGAAVIMTLGGNGALYRCGSAAYSQNIFSVTALDTTAAGDTFTGYFLSAICRSASVQTALQEAAAAAALAVSRQGAASSIPDYDETLCLIREQAGTPDA